MDLNDPFGRLQRQETAGYEALRRKLAEAGITEPEEIEEVLCRSRRKVAVFAAAVSVAALCLCLLLPKLTPVFLAAAVLMLAVAGKAALQGQRLMQRCRREAETESKAR